MIFVYYGFSDVFDNFIIFLCKFIVFSSEFIENLFSVFGSNFKVYIVVKIVFYLVYCYGDILWEGWKNIMEVML